MLIKIKFSEELKDFTQEEKLKIVGLKLERVTNNRTIKYKVNTEDITQVFTALTSLGYRNKLILSSNKEDGKFCIMELSK